MADDTRKILRSGLSASSYLPNNLGTTIGPISGFKADVTDPAANALTVPVSPNTRIAYSGADVYSFITPYSAKAVGTSFIPLKNLIAISYSTHRDKMPVRRLGTEMAVEYTLGTKTIAGSIVLLNFDRTALSELIIGKDIYGDTRLIETYDDLPPFDITLMFQEEIQGRFGDKATFGSTKQTSTFQHKDAEGDPVGNSITRGGLGNNPVTYSVLEIRGIRLIDEGLVIGTDEAYLETTFQYVAQEIKPLEPVILTANDIKGFGQILDGDQLTNINGKWFQGEDAFVYADDAQSLVSPPIINTLESDSSAAPGIIGFVEVGADPELPSSYGLTAEGLGNEIFGPKVDASTGQYDWNNGGYGVIAYSLIEPHDGKNTCTTTYTVTDSNGDTTDHTFISLETQAACESTGSTPPPTIMTNMPTNSSWSTGTWDAFPDDHVPWVGVNSKKWPPLMQDTNALGRVVFPISEEEMVWLHDEGHDALVHEYIENPGPRLHSVDLKEDADSYSDQTQAIQEALFVKFAGYCEAAFNATGRIFGACVGDKLGADSWL